MIIKPADDKQREIELIQALLSHPAADALALKRMRQEIRNIQAGIRGEQEAAYEMKVRWGDSKNWMIIHDLRIEFGDLVAQIDHLIINRFLDIWVCESKHFAEGVAINEHGEFTAFFGGKPYGVPSPIEQNNKHILILKRFFDSGTIKLPTRIGLTLKPDLKSLILVSKKARINRPKKKIDGIDSIVKNDQLFKNIEKMAEDSGVLSLAKIVGSDTLEEIAEEIASHHKPIQFDWYAKFGLAGLFPAAPTKPPATQMLTAIATSVPETVSPQRDGNQGAICQSCGIPVGTNVAKFCLFEKEKFGGGIYCMPCQKNMNS